MKAISAVFLSILSLAPLGAWSQTRTIGTFGSWRTFGGAAEDGTQVCGVITSGGEGRTFTIKYFEGTGYLAVQIFKDHWKIPDGQTIRIRIAMGSYTPWDITAQGAGNAIQFNVPAEKIKEFISEFRLAPNGSIRFLDGNEGSWSMNLSGSNAAVGLMVECMRQLDARKSQPFNRSSQPPSQPFNGSPASGAPRPSRGT